MPYDLRSAPQNLMDNLGRLKVSMHQNIYEADFEYGAQALRWEGLTAGGGAITHLPTQGGVQVGVGQAAGDFAIRQSRPYHRYQPGKTMYFASGTVFGAPVSGNRQRVGFFDDANGVFFEQAEATASNPSGMFVVRRSDSGGLPTDERVSFENWSAFDRTSSLYDSRYDQIIRNLNWQRGQMIWIEFAWYGFGLIRWGVFIDGVLLAVTVYRKGAEAVVERIREVARPGIGRPEKAGSTT